MRVLSLILLLLVSCAGVNLSTQNGQAKAYYRNGLAHEKKKAWDAAITDYRKALQEDSRFVEAHIALGRMYDEIGNYAKAGQFYENAMKLDESRDDILLAYGKALFNSEQFHDSYLQLLKFRNRHPQNVDAATWLAECARVLNDPAAGSYLVEVTRLDSQNVESWIALARYYYGEREFDKALPVYRRIFANTTVKEPVLRYEYGVCAAALADWKVAVAQLQESLSDGNDAPVLPSLLKSVKAARDGQFSGTAIRSYIDAATMLETADQSLDKKTQYQEITKRLEKALKLQPGFTLALKTLARVKFILGEDEAALTAYEQLIGSDEAGAADLANAAYLYFRQGDYRKAKDYYSRSYQLDASQLQVKDYLATIQNLLDGMINPHAYRLYEKGITAAESDSAEYYLLRATLADSTYYEAYLQLGIVYLRMNKHKQAEQQFLRGLVFVDDRDIERVLDYNLALTYLDMELHDKAVHYFNNALAIDSSDADARYYLAQTYSDKSELRKAVENYDALVRMHPGFFRPAENDFRRVGMPPSIPALTGRAILFDDQPQIGQTDTYELKISSKNKAILGADANGDLTREVKIIFDTQVEDVTSYGEVEYALDIRSVEGYALTAREKSIIGQRYYLRVSDVFGLTNIYGLLEGDPYSLQRFVIQTLEDLHGSFLRKKITQGEWWRSRQHAFRLGSIDGVAELDYLAEGKAFIKKYYGVQGTYNAARYGEEGMVALYNKGEVELEFDATKKTIVNFTNRFTTREFREATATTEVQEAGYALKLINSRMEKLEPPKKVVLDGIPYVRQHGPQCAAASLSMILQSYNDKIDQDDIYAIIKSEFAGAQADDILNYPRSLGKYKTFGYTGTLEDLKSRVDDGIPVLVFLTPYGYGHVVVVIGYDESKHQIIMHDPTVASNHAVGYDDFLLEWRQSGNECAIVVPFDRTIVLDRGPITSHKAVEMKWRGDKALGDHQYDKAMSLYRSALSIDKSYEGAMEGIMLLHLQRDNFDEASAVLDTLLELNPTSIDLVLKRASLLLSQYDYDKVLQITKRAKQMDESNIINYVYTASALFAQKKYDEAIEEIKQAVRINPLQSAPRNLLAGYYAEVGEWDKAYEQIGLAIKYEPENVGNYMTLSGLYQTEINNRFLTAQKRFELLQKALDALNVVKEAAPSLPNLDQIYADLYTVGDFYRTGDSLFLENIRKYPEENGAYNNYAWRLATDGEKLREAVSLSQKSIDLSQRNPYYFDTMAWIHLKIAMDFEDAGQKDSAETYFRSAEDLLKATIGYDKTSDFAYRHLGVVYARWGRMDKAREQFDIVEEMLPDKARLFTDIAKDCEEARLTDLALEYYGRALKEKSNLDYALYRSAYLLATTGRDLSTARTLILNALAIDSASFLYSGTLGIIDFLSGNTESARTRLGRTVMTQADYGDREAAIHWYYLGLVYEKLGKKKEAFEALRRYLTIEPAGVAARDARKRISGS